MKLEILQKDMIAAMKAKDKFRKDCISSLVSATKKVAIDEGCREDVPEELVDRVKEIYTQKEFVNATRRGTRALDRMSQLIKFSRMWFAHEN